MTKKNHSAQLDLPLSILFGDHWSAVCDFGGNVIVILQLAMVGTLGWIF